MKHLQPIIYGMPDISQEPIPEYSNSSYKLGAEVINGIKWWGNVQFKNKEYTALFICPKCNSTFREQITKVLNETIITCKCN
jgi:hypothetical protein